MGIDGAVSVLGPSTLQPGGVGAVARGQRRGRDPVEEDAERDGQRHGGQHDLGRRRAERVDGDEPEDDRGESARPEPADEGDGGAVEAGAGRAMRDGDHAHDGQGEDGENDVTPVQVLEARHEHDGAEGEPDEQGEQRPGLLGEVQTASWSLWWSIAAEGHAADEGGDEPVRPGDVGRRIGEERQGEDGERPDPAASSICGAGTSRGAGRRRRRSPTPSAAPPTSSTTALVRCVPLTASAVTAPAMKRLTNGVAMPSFRPLSTLRTRRTPAGTRSSCMIEAPSAASVGATMAPMAAATQSPRAANRSSGHGGAGGDGQRQAEAEQAGRDGGVGAERAHVDPARRRRRARGRASPPPASGWPTSAG